MTAAAVHWDEAHGVGHEGSRIGGATCGWNRSHGRNPLYEASGIGKKEFKIKRYLE